VEMGGVEPPSKQRTRQLSTRLFFPPLFRLGHKYKQKKRQDASSRRVLSKQIKLK
jgi:hypothetical protein